MIAPETLQNYPFFAGFNQTTVKSLAQIAAPVSFAAGELIFKEGDCAGVLFLLVEGWVDILIDIDRQGRRELVTTLTPGDMFGWSAVVEPHIYTTSAVCASPVRGIGFEGRRLRALFAADQELCCAIMSRVCRIIASRLRATRAQMVNLLLIG